MSKWALVTGSAQRIGRAIALDLASEGWNIIVHFNSSEEEALKTLEKVKALKRQAHLLKLDFTNKRATEECIPALAKELGPLTALVNNASLFEPDSHAPGGHDHRSVNLDAPLLLAEAFRKQLPPGKTGAIVNILDACVSPTGFSAYAHSKKSLRAMTIEMARRMAPEVRVNGVSPGPVLPNARQTEQHHKQMVASTLLRTEITPQSVAKAVSFFIENPSITGEILHIDGGVRLQNTPSMARAVAS